MRYSAILAPLSRGGDHDKRTVVREKRSGAATGLLGSPGVRIGSNGVTAPEGREVPDRPPAFSATAVNVYAVPLVRPVTVQELLRESVTDTVHVRPLGDDVNVMVA
jgi:hypothetical protein